MNKWNQLGLGLVLAAVSGMVLARGGFDPADLAFREREGVPLPPQAVWRDSDEGAVRIGDLEFAFSED